MRKKFLIFGLGNPEDKYLETFHNAGWQTIDQLIIQENSPNSLQENKKIDCLMTIIKKKDYDLILAQPLSFMNLSGIPLKKTIQFYDLSPQQILIIQDDADLPLGTLRFSFDSGSGGHNGIKSIFQETARQDFHRLRLGIGRPEEKRSLKNFVLQKISSSAKKDWQAVLEKAAQGVISFCENGPEKTASLFN